MKQITGLNSFRDCEYLASICSNKNVLLVSGKASYQLSGAEAALKDIIKNSNLVTFNNFDVNPKLDDAIRGANLAKKSNIDTIIAVGGGSVLDMAKLIKAFCRSNDDEKEIATGQKTFEDPRIPMIAIPTTAGSGSEATHFAVVYVDNEKYSLANQCLLPDLSILDGRLVLSGSRYLKACNALDAMAQAIESLWATNSTVESRSFASRALNLGWYNISKYLTDECTPEVAQKMLEASNLAGKAINVSKTTAAHAWSYAFTSNYSIPHGHAVWMTLPAVFEVHASSDSRDITDNRGVEHVKNIMNELIEILGSIKKTAFKNNLSSA